MKLLVDTCTLIWALQSPSRLSRNARTLLEDSRNQILVSVISLWEITLKHSIGRIAIYKAQPEDIPQFVEEIGWQVLPLDIRTASTFHRLPRSKCHHDPFDRLLVWTAIVHQLPLVSKDRSLHEYTSVGLHLIG